MIKALKLNLIYPFIFLLTILIPLAFEYVFKNSLGENALFLTFVVFCPMGLVVLGLIKDIKTSFHHFAILIASAFTVFLVNPGVNKNLLWKSPDWLYALGICYLVGMIHSIFKNKSIN